MLYIEENALEKVGQAKEWSDNLDWFFVEPERARLRQLYAELIEREPDWEPPSWSEFPYNPDDTVEAWLQGYIDYQAIKNTKFYSFRHALDHVSNWGASNERKSFVYIWPDFTKYGLMSAVYLQGAWTDPKHEPSDQMVRLISQEHRVTKEEAHYYWHLGIVMGMIYKGPSVNEVATYKIPPNFYWGWVPNS